LQASELFALGLPPKKTATAAPKPYARPVPGEFEQLLNRLTHSSKPAPAGTAASAEKPVLPEQPAPDTKAGSGPNQAAGPDDAVTGDLPLLLAVAGVVPGPSPEAVLPAPDGQKAETPSAGIRLVGGLPAQAIAMQARLQIQAEPAATGVTQTAPEASAVPNGPASGEPSPGGLPEQIGLRFPLAELVTARESHAGRAPLAGQAAPEAQLVEADGRGDSVIRITGPAAPATEVLRSVRPQGSEVTAEPASQTPDRTTFGQLVRLLTDGEASGQSRHFSDAEQQAQALVKPEAASGREAGKAEAVAALSTMAVTEPEAAAGPEAAPEGPGRAAEPVVRQVVNFARVILREGQSEARLQLHPEHLGQVQIKLIVAEGVVKAHLTVTEQSVKAALDANLDQFRLRMAEQGLQVQQIQVSVGAQQFQGHERGERFQDGLNQQHGDRESGTTGEEPAPGERGTGQLPVQTQMARLRGIGSRLNSLA
jgi:flagellar hook-length control protein FliK